MTTSKSTRGLGKIVSNPTGTWTLRYWANGKQREETFSTKALAQDRQAKIWHDKRSGEITFTDKAKGAVPFVTYVQSWIDGHQNAGTRAWMTTTLKRITPDLGTKTLVQVANDRELVQAIISAAPLSYEKKVRMVLVSPLNEALKSGRISSHRLRGLKVNEASPAAKEFTFATRAQIDRMALALGDRAMIVWLGVYAGLRVGESLGVNISDFTDGGTNLRVQRQRQDMTLTDNLKARKSGEFRDVPVSDELYAKVLKAPTDEDGYLFRSEYRRSTYNAFNRARDLAGLPKSYTTHSLRDQYATTLLANLVPITDVARYLGHSSIQITFKYYSKHIPSADVRAREVIDAALAG
jgi:hypothetical protein